MCRSPVRTSVTPVRLSSPNCLCCIGRRKSPSMIRTGCPAWARRRPRFETTVDLPSPGFADVMTIARGGSSRLTKRRFVRSLRRASNARLLLAMGVLFARSLLSRFRSALSGSTASTLALSSFSTSSLVRTRASSIRRLRAMTPPRPKPPAAPSKRLRSQFGDTGLTGATAGSKLTSAIADWPLDSSCSSEPISPLPAAWMA